MGATNGPHCLLAVPTLHENLLWISKEEANDTEVGDDVSAGDVQLFDVWAVVTDDGKEHVIWHVPLQRKMREVCPVTDHSIES